MADRPTIDPGVLATLTEAAPARLIRKLDKAPERAEAWAWSHEGDAWSIDADGKATVTLTGPHLASADQVACSCLLAPKCLHILSVVSRLEIGGDAEVSGVAEDVPVPETPDEAGPVALTDAQRAAASQLETVLTAQLEAGFRACGVIGQGRLLRAVHACRVHQLPRLASAGVRITRQVKALHDRSADFETPRLAADVASALEVSARVAAGEPGPSDIGVSRRRYQTVGSLKLIGLFTEPISTASGYGGVVTWLADREGRLYSVSDVRPGPPDRPLRQYGAGVDIGDASLAHRELCRAGLFLSRATASASGRLGRGKDVEAVRAKPVPWTDPALDAVFGRPLAAQVQAVLDASEIPEDQRDEAWDLVFFDAMLGNGRLTLDDGRVLHMRVASDATELRYRENARILERASGRVRVAARLAVSTPGVVVPLALHPLDEGVVLDSALGGLCNLGLDRLRGAAARGGARTSVPNAQADVLGPLRRRLFRVLLGGASALPQSAGPVVDRDRARLQQRLLTTGADLLAELHLAARSGPSGTRGGSDTEALAMAYTRGVAYVALVERYRVEQAWR